jgi:hypothetical protein
MLTPNYIKRVLNNFGKAVVQQSRSRLTKEKKNATNELYNSLSFTPAKVSNRGNLISFSFEMLDYGEFIDKGVSGVDVKYKTPFSYSTKPPPPSVFSEWAKAKGIKPRDKKTGKFITAKQFGFIMSRHIFSKGQEPTNFFTLSFEQQYKKLPDELLKAFGDDLDEFLKD